jgi:hypothetical protein
MYISLAEKCDDFHLYIFTFDENSHSILSSLFLNHVTIISLNEFEDTELLKVKQTRSKGEYCWTCTSSTILYCLENYFLDHCTYIDADLFFFNNPKVLHDEMGNNDVLITGHRYSPEYDQSEKSGIYCVQYITFKNTENSIKILKWWRNACLNWCYATYEDGKFGDQMYLDDWTTRFNGVHVLKHLGGGVAPWNVNQYQISQNGIRLLGKEISTGVVFDVIFYHFHAIYCRRKSFIREYFFEGYNLTTTARNHLYKKYIPALTRSFRKLKKINPSVDSLSTKDLNYTWIKYAKIIRRRILNKENNYRYWIYYG